MPSLSNVQWWGWFGGVYPLNWRGWSAEDKPTWVYKWRRINPSSQPWATTAPSSQPWATTAPSSQPWRAANPQNVGAADD